MKWTKPFGRNAYGAASSDAMHPIHSNPLGCNGEAIQLAYKARRQTQHQKPKITIQEDCRTGQACRAAASLYDKRGCRMLDATAYCRQSLPTKFGTYCSGPFGSLLTLRLGHLGCNPKNPCPPSASRARPSGSHSRQLSKHLGPKGPASSTPGERGMNTSRQIMDAKPHKAFPH